MGRGVSDRQIAQSLSLSRPTVAAYVQRAQAVGVSWPLPDGLTEAALERLLFPPRPAKGAIAHLVPDWATIHQELKRKGVTLLFCGRNIKLRHLRVSSTAGFARHIGPGPPSLISSCARATARARNSLSITRARPFRW